VPTETAVTIPAPVPTVATAVVPLAQLPPVVVSVSVIVDPVQAREDPPIAAGNGLTVTILVAKQPDPVE